MTTLAILCPRSLTFAANATVGTVTCDECGATVTLGYAGRIPVHHVPTRERAVSLAPRAGAA